MLAHPHGVIHSMESSEDNESNSGSLVATTRIAARVQAAGDLVDWLGTAKIALQVSPNLLLMHLLRERRDPALIMHITNHRLVCCSCHIACSLKIRVCKASLPDSRKSSLVLSCSMLPLRLTSAGKPVEGFSQLLRNITLQGTKACLGWDRDPEHGTYACTAVTDSWLVLLQRSLHAARALQHVSQARIQPRPLQSQGSAPFDQQVQAGDPAQEDKGVAEAGRVAASYVGALQELLDQLLMHWQVCQQTSLIPTISWDTHIGIVESLAKVNLGSIIHLVLHSFRLHGIYDQYGVQIESKSSRFLKGMQRKTLNPRPN